MTSIGTRIITRGAKIGRCNVCGAHGPLTEDHIPPKGVSRLGQVAMMHVTDLLSIRRPNKSTRYSQNGVKYRTLCKRCNNERLGLGYDPALIEFTRQVRSYLDSALYLPAQMSFRTQPNRLVRCIAGHLLAQGVGEHRGGTMIEAMTDYFLDEGQPFPPGLKLYYWLYPYTDQVIVKGAGLSLNYWKSFAVFMLLKFFPLSFLFVQDEPPEWQLPFARLDTLLSERIDDEAWLPVGFSDLPPQRWPEAPGDTGMILYGDGAVGATPVSSLSVQPDLRD